MAYDLEFEKPLAVLERQISEQEKKVEGAQATARQAQARRA